MPEPTTLPTIAPTAPGMLASEQPVAIWKTKTFLSLMLMLAGSFLPKYATFLAEPDVLELLSKFIEVIGAAGVMYGRLHSTKTASISPPAPPSPPAEPQPKDELGEPPATVPPVPPPAP